MRSTRGKSAAHGGIEETAADAEEDPGIDSQGEAKGQADVEQLGGVRRHRDGGSTLALGLRVGHLGAGESEEQEEDGSGELACHCYEMIAQAIRHEAY